MDKFYYKLECTNVTTDWKIDGSEEIKKKFKCQNYTLKPVLSQTSNQLKSQKKTL